MSDVIKKFKFQYAMLVYKDEHDGKEKKFDFRNWLIQTGSLDHEQRTVQIFANYARLDKWYQDDRDGLIGLRFLRLRDSNLPYKVPMREEAKDLDIGDDEFIGESLHIVYDTMTRFFMIQVNRFSMSLKGIETYINQLNRDSDKIVYFKVFHKELDLPNLRFNRYKVLEIGLANVGTPSCSHNGFIGGIINNIQDLSPHSAKLIFSVGRSRGKSLTNGVVEQFFREIPSHREIITDARIKCCEGDSEKGEEINLLDFMEESILELRIETRKTIGFEYAINQMKYEYMQKKIKLVRMLSSQ